MQQLVDKFIDEYNINWYVDEINTLKIFVGANCLLAEISCVTSDNVDDLAKEIILETEMFYKWRKKQ